MNSFDLPSQSTHNSQRWSWNQEIARKEQHSLGNRKFHTGPSVQLAFAKRQRVWRFATSEFHDSWRSSKICKGVGAIIRKRPLLHTIQEFFRGFPFLYTCTYLAFWCFSKSMQAQVKAVPLGKRPVALHSAYRFARCRRTLIPWVFPIRDSTGWNTLFRVGNGLPHHLLRRPLKDLQPPRVNWSARSPGSNDSGAKLMTQGISKDYLRNWHIHWIEYTHQQFYLKLNSSKQFMSCTFVKGACGQRMGNTFDIGSPLSTTRPCQWALCLQDPWRIRLLQDDQNLNVSKGTL